MDDQDLRALAINAAMNTEYFGDVNGLIVNADKIFDFLRGQLASVPTGEGGPDSGPAPYR